MIEYASEHQMVAPLSAGPSSVTPVGVSRLADEAGRLPAPYLSMPSLRRVRNAVPGVTSLSPLVQAAQERAAAV